ncbi:thioredoxin reductase [Chlorobium ferrooxidans DSM 13031]|uniref:Thioredoxin reductase n=2 Tax=Chlorobium TaxID=1091 RepID=Q0YQR4_9CHLB|nr:thioredoxin reductase [Chlorobium ferrooxidans DSM 13031]
MTNMEREVRDIVIMGTGPAGYTAAIYTGRSNLKPLIIEGLQPGGQLMITTEIENFPGFPEGIRGPELMSKMREQAAKFGAEFLAGSVTEVDLSRSPFSLQLEDGRELFTHALIVATGACAKWLGIESEDRYRGKGVSACATCDGFFFRDSKVFVIGGGDTAMEEALYLTKFASEVVLVHRREEFRSSKIMSLRVQKNPKIRMLLNEVVDEILGDGMQVTGIRLKNVKTGELVEHSCDGVFLAIGHSPNTALFKGQLDLDDYGYIKTKKSSSETSVAGVFACGDVQDFNYRQAVTAVGTGCMAAVDTERFLETIR